MKHYLIAESESPDERAGRRGAAGRSSAESFAATLGQLDPGAQVDIVDPRSDSVRGLDAGRLADFDAVFLSGSPIHVYEDRPEVAAVLDFMAAIFASGTPAFGSCAGLQVAAAAAGGRVRSMPKRMEAGIARRIAATDDGREHPLLAGRPIAWDAPAIHGDEVEALPPGARLLATNGATRVQAAEIRFGRGIFWGVQYHPELSPGEIGVAIRRQAAELVEAGLSRSAAEIDRHAGWFDVLDRDPDDGAARWHLGIGDDFAFADQRRCELRNFLSAAPRLKARGG